MGRNDKSEPVSEADLHSMAIIDPGKVVLYSVKNAISLIDEAEILYKHKKYARANLLALTAVEEIAKADIVYRHHHRGSNIDLGKDLLSHPVKFGSKDKITVWPKKKIAFGTKGDKAGAWRDKKSREDSMYVDYRNGKYIRPINIRSYKAKTTIRRAKKDLFYLYFEHILTVWPKYNVKLPKPPYYIKVKKGYESSYNIRIKPDE